MLWARRKRFLRQKKYGVRDLGFPKKFCGIQIETREDGSLLLHQTDANIAFLDDLESGGIHTKGLPVPLVPMDPGLELTDYADKGTVPPNDAAYRYAVGYLGWLISRTMPKLAFCFLKLSGAVGRNTQQHDDALLQVLLYLRGHASEGLIYGEQPWEGELASLVGYTDASFAMDRTTGKSDDGFCVFFRGCLVSWKCYT